MSAGAIRAGRAMVEIFADSSPLARGLAAAQNRLARFAANMRRLGTLQVVVGASFAAPLAAAVIQYAKLEQRLNTVRALTGATAGQMVGLSSAVRSIGMSTGIAFTEIADAMGELGRAGVGIGDLGNATKAVAQFARAASVEMGRAANITVEILTQFGLGMDHVVHVTDVLQEMANATVSSVEDLADGFRYAGQTANMFGLSLEQTAAAIAFLQQSGLSATTAGTSLNQMLLQMVQNLVPLEAAIGNLRDADGEFLPLGRILEKLQSFLKDMPGPERVGFLNKMFDVRGMRGANALLQNLEEWTRLTKQAEGSMGATARKSMEMAKAFAVSFDRMKNGVAALSYAIGEVLDADLRFAFDAIGNGAQTVGKFVTANAELVKSLARTTAMLVASGVGFFTMGISLQLAAFSIEGFLKLGRGLLAPFTAIRAIGVGAFSMLNRVIGFSIARTMGMVRWTGRLALEFYRAGAATLNVIRQLIIATRLMMVAVGPIALVARALMGLNVVLGSAFAVAAFAGPIATLVAGVGGVTVAVYALQSAFEAIISIGPALLSGMTKIWEGVAADAAAVWPEISATLATGFAGISAAIRAGDLTMAWNTFVATAQAAFAQVMMIIGPFVDGAAIVLKDIWNGFTTAASAAINTAADLVKEILFPIWGAMANIGGSIFQSVAGGVSGISDLFSGLGEHAEEAGQRIFDALEAGDIVGAWIAATTAIKKMMAEIANFWDQNVAAPMRLAGAQYGSAAERKAMLQRHGMLGRDLARQTAELSYNPMSHAELRAQRQALLDRPENQNEERRAAIEEAYRHRRDVLLQAGVLDPAEREAKLQAELDAIEAKHNEQNEARRKQREENRAKRREAADVAAARAASLSSSAQEREANNAIAAKIEAANSGAEVAKAQDEINARRAAAEKVDAEAGINPRLPQAREVTIPFKPPTQEELDAAAAEDDKERREAAAEHRIKAAEERRKGNEAAARRLEATATQLEQALDIEEEHALMERAQERQQEIADEKARRKKAKDAVEGANARTGERLDAIGGFQNNALDRMGFGQNLAEKQLEATKDVVKGVNEVAQILRGGAMGVFA